MKISNPCVPILPDYTAHTVIFRGVRYNQFKMRIALPEDGSKQGAQIPLVRTVRGNQYAEKHTALLCPLPLCVKYLFRRRPIAVWDFFCQ